MHAVQHPDNVEALDIDASIDGITFILLGWVVKYIISVKGKQAVKILQSPCLCAADNYFGNFSHFVSQPPLPTPPGS